LVCLLLAGVVATAAAGPVARAQDAEMSSRDREARSLYDAGRIAFDEGRFENALDYFKRAYELSQRPGLLHNIGTTADRLRRDEEALEAFQAYLEAVPDAPNRASVEARIAVLQHAIDERRQAEAPPDVVPPPSNVEPPPAVVVQTPPTPEGAAVTPSDSGPSPAVTWSLVGGGGGVAVAGVVLLAVGQSHRNQIEGASVGTAWSDVSKYDNADALTGAGVAMLGVGVAAAAVGLVLLLTSDDEDDTSASLVIGPGSVMIRGTM